jgi:hypothetical protein
MKQVRGTSHEGWRIGVQLFFMTVGNREWFEKKQ